MKCNHKIPIGDICFFSNDELKFDGKDNICEYAEMGDLGYEWFCAKYAHSEKNQTSPLRNKISGKAMDYGIPFRCNSCKKENK